MYGPLIWGCSTQHYHLRSPHTMLFLRISPPLLHHCLPDCGAFPGPVPCAPVPPSSSWQPLSSFLFLTRRASALFRSRSSPLLHRLLPCFPSGSCGHLLHPKHPYPWPWLPIFLTSTEMLEIIWEGLCNYYRWQADLRLAGRALAGPLP